MPSIVVCNAIFAHSENLRFRRMLLIFLRAARNLRLTFNGNWYLSHIFHEARLGRKKTQEAINKRYINVIFSLGFFLRILFHFRNDGSWQRIPCVLIMCVFRWTIFPVHTTPYFLYHPFTGYTYILRPNSVYYPHSCNIAGIASLALEFISNQQHQQKKHILLSIDCFFVLTYRLLSIEM